MARRLTRRQRLSRLRQKRFDEKIKHEVWRRAERRAAEILQHHNLRNEWGTAEMFQLQAKVASQAATIYRLEEELKQHG